MPKVRNRTPQEIENDNAKVLHSAAVLFLENGFEKTTLKKIAEHSGLDVTAVFRSYGNKDNLLCELVKFVLKQQFKTAAAMIAGKTEDKILYYAAETTLQLYMAESHEHIRELYAAAYSLPATTDYIQNTIAGKLEEIFKEQLPQLEAKDFYELELASGGIMRSFMLAPCDRYFTMDRKVRRFLETTFKVFDVPTAKIEEAIEFVSQFDYETKASDIINNMLKELKEKEQL